MYGAAETSCYGQAADPTPDPLAIRYLSRRGRRQQPYAAKQSRFFQEEQSISSSLRGQSGGLGGESGRTATLALHSHWSGLMTASDVPEASEASAQTPAEKRFPRLKRPDRPDLAKLKADVDGLQSQRNEHKRRVEEIGETLNQRRGNRQPGGEQQKLRTRLNDLTGQFKRELVSLLYSVSAPG